MSSFHKINLLGIRLQAKLKISLTYEPPPSANGDAAQGGEAEGDEDMEEDEDIGEPGKPGVTKWDSTGRNVCEYFCSATVQRRQSELSLFSFNSMAQIWFKTPLLLPTLDTGSISLLLVLIGFHRSSDISS